MQLSFYVNGEVVEFYENGWHTHVELRNQSGTVVLQKGFNFAHMITGSFGLLIYEGKWRDHKILVKVTINKFTIPYRRRYRIWVDDQLVTDQVLKSFWHSS